MDGGKLLGKSDGEIREMEGEGMNRMKCMLFYTF